MCKGCNRGSGGCRTMLKHFMRLAVFPVSWRFRGGLLVVSCCRPRGPQGLGFQAQQLPKETLKLGTSRQQKHEKPELESQKV